MELTKVVNSLPVKGLRPGYRKDIEQFNQFAAGRSVSQELILDYFDHLKSENKAPATLQRHKASIKESIRSLKGAGLTIIDKAQLDAFFKDIKTGTRDMSVNQEDVLSEDELDHLIKLSGNKTRLIIAALYETAARVSELANIKLKDCKERGNGIIIDVIGKGSKEGTFFMSKVLFDAIRNGYQGKKYLFEVNGKAISRMTIYTMIKRAGKKINRPDLHPHTLRHTWATLSLPSLGLSKVSAYLRHSDTSTTAKFYLHGKADISEVMAINTLKLKIAV